MYLTPNGCVSPINRDCTSIFIKIKECVKPILDGLTEPGALF